MATKSSKHVTYGPTRMGSTDSLQPTYEPVFPRVIRSNVKLPWEPLDLEIIPVDRRRIRGGYGAGNRGSGLGASSIIVIEFPLIFKSSTPKLPFQVGLDAPQRCETQLQDLVLLGKPVIHRGNITSRTGPGGSLNGHFLIEDIKDAVYAPDEVELDDGCPDQTFLFPSPRGIFQLEVCGVDGARVTIAVRD